MNTRLQRQIGLPGALVIGLGSVLGTGIFVSIALAAELTGPAVLVAVVLAGLIATCNGFSSAALAAVHPVSGGAYEYGYRFLNPALGFSAGWMFLVAKSASAATAALGFAAYAWTALGGRLPGSTQGVLVALALILVMTALVAAGIRRSNRLNTVIVAFTLAALVSFVVLGLYRGPDWAALAPGNWRPAGGWADLLKATALAFVAFTGYGRIATLGEEVKNPRWTIPRAVILTLGATLLLYGAVALVGFAAPPAALDNALESALASNTPGNAETLAGSRGFLAPLAQRAALLGGPGLAWFLSLAAMTAMAGVLLNLILGLSRVLLAMGRRGDMPAVLARLRQQKSGPSPLWAGLAVGVLVGALALLGDVRTTWSFSAFAVLIYYSITNAAALRIPRDQALYPRWISWCGLVGSLVPAFFVEARVWLLGLGILALGLVWHGVARRLAGSKA